MVKTTLAFCIRNQVSIEINEHLRVQELGGDRKMTEGSSSRREWEDTHEP